MQIRNLNPLRRATESAQRLPEQRQPLQLLLNLKRLSPGRNAVNQSPPLLVPKKRITKKPMKQRRKRLKSV